MLGIECATIPAGRVRAPETTIPRATLAGTLIAALLYCAVSVVPMLLIPQAQLAASNAPFADLFSRELGGQYGSMLAAFVIVSALGSAQWLDARDRGTHAEPGTPPRLPAGAEPGERARRPLMGTFGLRGGDDPDAAHQLQ